MSTIDKEEIFEFNKAEILVALSELGVKLIEVQYSGANDSGDEFEIRTTPNVKESLQNTKVLKKSIKHVFDSISRTHAEHISETNESLEDAFADLVEEIIAMNGHSGWENNDGGGGHFLLNVQSGEFTLEHYHNEVHITQHTSTYQG